MQKELLLLLEKFKNLRNTVDDTIPPLLVTTQTALFIAEYLSGREIPSKEILISEVLDGIFIFAPEEEGDSFKIRLAREMSEKAHVRSSTGWKAFFAFGMADLTLEAANSLLKIFEDIPSDTLFVLVSDAPKDLLPDTILSRVICIDSAEIHYQLDEKIQSAIEKFEKGDRAPLVTELFGFFKKKRENPRNEALAIISTLLKMASKGVLQTSEIEALEKAFLATASTNATPKWVLDRAVMVFSAPK